ncbi:MAG TPA: polysaccharide biosynthesis/export family protein [Myxococcaceae bacterium]
MDRRRSGMVLAVTVALLGMGCAHRTRTAPQASEPEPYRIGREDVLDISVWRDPELSRMMPVRPDGFVSLPIVGDVAAAGRTPVELAADIQKKLQPYVQEPRVTVLVREVNSARVYVTGEVAHPGAYPLRGRVSVLQAIALAGGFTDFADRDGMMVVRKGQQAGQIPVRYTDLVTDERKSSQESLDLDVDLMPGDTVVVP